MLCREDKAVIDALARHYRCPLSEKAEMIEHAENDPEVMASYRIMANEIATPSDRRNSPAYKKAMADLAAMGLRRRKAA